MKFSFGGGEAMRWNQEEHGLTPDEDRTTWGISYREQKDVKEISDFMSQNCDNLQNLFEGEQFGMFTIMSPKEVVFDDEDVSLRLPKDPFALDFTETDYLAYFIKDTDRIVKFLLEANELINSNNVSYEGNDSGEADYTDWIVKFLLDANELINSTNVSYEGNDSGEADSHKEPVEDEDRDSVWNLIPYYLTITDLLTIEGVCRSLRDEVRSNAALWQNVKLDSSWNLKKINDEKLMWLTDRARGSLCSLDLSSCFKVTNVGLRHVLNCNPKLTKLDLVGCNKVNVEDLLQDLKGFNAKNSPGGIKYLRVGELSNLTNEHVEEFRSLLGVNRGEQHYAPRYHLDDQLYLSLDNERALDVETCPKCEKPKQVFDCPLASCREKARSNDECRGCFQCIARCVCCGCCLGDKPYEETFTLHLCCVDCCSPYPSPLEIQEVQENGDEARG